VLPDFACAHPAYGFFLHGVIEKSHILASSGVSGLAQIDEEGFMTNHICFGYGQA
jgi:hypothetical protein